MKIVAVISANAEWRVVKELYPRLEIQHSPYGEFADLTITSQTLTLFHGGWGKISAAASAQYVIDHFKPDLLINLGTCGGFAGRIEKGTIILVERTLVYDIIEQMGDGAEAIEHYSTEIDLSWMGKGRRTEDEGRKKTDDGGRTVDKGPRTMDNGQRAVGGNIVRGLLVSADRDIVAEDIPMLIEKYNAVAADWESGAIAWVAQKNNTHLLILRAVSDLVGSEGGEAYGNIELFHERTKVVMQDLFQQLPKFL
jgi:adenosylhomocysteine nucleosidase